MDRRTVIGVFAALAALLGGCTEPATTSSIDQSATVCGGPSTVAGVDISYYDDSVDWNAAHAAGIDFAFIRVTDGTQYQDPRFAAYWQGAKAAGVLRGAYQFFRPAEDPIAQADLFLSLAPYEVGDLPPVLDVEVNGGLTQPQVAAAVHTWVDHVTAAIGRVPIVYAGLYSWPDLTGSADLTSSPLWIAQYTTAACPNIPSPWTKWLFWQHSDTGKVDGVVSSQLDLDLFNGTLDELQQFANADTPPCGTIGADGGIVDDGDACFTPGGPTQYMRHVTDAGDSGLYWTHTTTAASEANYGQWNLNFAAAGTYHVEAFTAAAYATSHAADYLVQAAGAQQSITIDQTAADGWQPLGDIAFAAGGNQWINLGDNTGESPQQQLVFDAIRFTPVDTGSGSGSGAHTPGDESSGCSTTKPSGGGFLVLAVLGLVRRRRR
ncbi:MAG: GH25 family lysozyme [Deltaproteobacteria bacterium]